MNGLAEKAIYGFHLAAVFHALWDHWTMGLQQVRMPSCTFFSLCRSRLVANLIETSSVCLPASSQLALKRSQGNKTDQMQDRSDDLLYPTRWQNLLSLSPAHSPDIIQIISWNDYGESHYIAPPSGPGSGAQPGSEAWTKGMPHEAFREMTWYFIGRWRDRQPEVGGGALRVWMWYRPHTARMTITGDEVGRPDHADWVSLLLVPSSSSPSPRRDDANDTSGCRTDTT